MPSSFSEGRPSPCALGVGFKEWPEYFAPGRAGGGGMLYCGVDEYDFRA